MKKEYKWTRELKEIKKIVIEITAAFIAGRCNIPDLFKLREDRLREILKKAQLQRDKETIDDLNSIISFLHGDTSRASIENYIKRYML